MSERIYGVATKAWQIVAGCDERMPCAEKCWAKNTVHRLAWSSSEKIRTFHEGLVAFNDGLKWTGTVRLNESHLTDPLKWRKPAVVATGYHGDLFRLPAEQIDRAFAVMALCPQHTFLVLTKCAKEMEEYCRRLTGGGAIRPLFTADDLRHLYPGFSASNQSEFDARWPHMEKLGLSGWKAWVSLEPMIGPINLRLDEYAGDGAERRHLLSQVVLGSESGKDARPMSEDWVRAVRDQCASASVPFFYKQNVVNGKKIHMPELDGRTHDQLAWEVGR